jgi:Tfp pilus assembly protein PilF
LRPVYEQAKGVLKKALEVDQKNRVAHWYLGYSLQKTGHPAEAHKEYQEWRKLLPKGQVPGCCGMDKM